MAVLDLFVTAETLLIRLTCFISLVITVWDLIMLKLERK